MSNEDRIKSLEDQIARLQARQEELSKQLAQAEIDRWQGRIEDLEVQMHLGAMEANDRLAGLLEQVRRRWSEATAQYEGPATAATEGLGAVRNSLQTAYKEIRQALLDTKSKLVP
jgi:ubiquinone biosynthesis protein UbiJ